MMAAMHRFEHLMAKVVEPTLLAIKPVCAPHDHVLTDRETLIKSNHYNVYLQCDLGGSSPIHKVTNSSIDSLWMVSD